MIFDPLDTEIKVGDPDHHILHIKERECINILGQVTSPYFDPTTYGAVGDGLHDDTDAINDAFIAAKVAGGTVVLPNKPGYRITDTLTGLQNSGGVVVRGYGMPGHFRPASRLVWDGATDGRPMLDVSGAGYLHLEDFGLFANTSAAGSGANVVGIKAVGNPAFFGSFFNSSRRLYLHNCAVGADIGSESDQVDTWTWDKCWFVYDTADGIGIRINSTNALVIQLLNCTLTGAGAGAMVSSAGVHINTGSVKLYGCITARNKCGIRITATPSGTTGIFGHHSEGDGTAVYTDAVDGNHQKANSLSINDLYVYHSADAMLQFKNENLQYSVRSAFSQPSGGVDDIIVPDGAQEVWLWDVTHTGKVRRASDNTEIGVYGSYGNQGPGARKLRLPSTDLEGLILKSENGTEFRVVVSNAGVLSGVQV